MAVLTDAGAWEGLEQLFWDGRPECAHCSSLNVGYLRPRNGVSRRTHGGGISYRRVWRCHDCRRQFSVLTNGALNRCQVPARKLLEILLGDDIDGKDVRPVAAKYGVDENTIYRLRQRMGISLAGPRWDAP